MSDADEIKTFFTEARRIARTLSASGAGAPIHEWRADGLTHFGWLLKRGEYRTVKDEQLGRIPYYMGGSWGKWQVFLGLDGAIYEHQFRGTDVRVSGEIVTTLSDRVIKKSVSSLMGPDRRFTEYRRALASLLR